MKKIQNKFKFEGISKTSIDKDFQSIRTGLFFNR